LGKLGIKFLNWKNFGMGSGIGRNNWNGNLAKKVLIPLNLSFGLNQIPGFLFPS